VSLHPFAQHGQPGVVARNEAAEAPLSEADANVSFFCEAAARWASSGCGFG